MWQAKNVCGTVVVLENSKQKINLQELAMLEVARVQF